MSVVKRELKRGNEGRMCLNKGDSRFTERFDLSSPPVLPTLFVVMWIKHGTLQRLSSTFVLYMRGAVMVIDGHFRIILVMSRSIGRVPKPVVCWR